MKLPDNISHEVIQACVCPECHSQLKVTKRHYQCQQCGTVFEDVNGIPILLSPKRRTQKINELSDLYDRASARHKFSPQSCGYSGKNAFETRLMVLKNWFNFDQLIGKKILDVGCGAGLLTENLVAQNAVWGVDISLLLLTMAKQKGLKSILSSADALPFRTKNFDIVLCVGVIPYYREPGKIISEICRAIKPEGKIVVSSSANSFILRLVRYMKKALGLKSQLERLYTCKELEKILKSEGITIEDSCIGYNDKIWSFSKGPMNYKQKLLARTVAVIGEAKPNP